jgi:hypothetical protein
MLPSLRVTEVTAVRDITNPDVAAVVLTGWQTRATPRFQAGILERATGWPAGVLEVDLTHGYDTVPPEVRAVVLDLAELMANTRGGARRQTAGPFTLDAGEHDLTGLHRMVLDSYRIPGTP